MVPSYAAVVSFVLQESPDLVAMGGLLPEKGRSPPVVPSPQICHMPDLSWLPCNTAWPLWAGGGQELHEPGSWGPAGTQPSTILSLLPPATATPGGHCHPGEAANGAGCCWGRFVFSSSVINPWQIRGAPGEQTRPEQSKNASSQPGKQFHGQDSPSPVPLPSWH